MIDTLIIKNFKSLKNVRFDLQKINLFIGPNNSGKTNALKVFPFIFDTLLLYERKINEDNNKINKNNFRRFYFEFGAKNKLIFDEPISFTFIKKQKTDFEYYILEFWGITKNEHLITRELLAKTHDEFPDNFNIGSWETYKSNFIDFDILIDEEGKIVPGLQENLHYNKIEFRKNNSKPLITHLSLKNVLFLSTAIPLSIVNELKEISSSIRIYQPNPNEIKKEKPLGPENFLKADASNLVSFLDTLHDNYPDIFDKIKEDLTTCLSEVKDFRFKKGIINEHISKQLGLVDAKKNVFWSDELSEGTLYFLALLAIIHQPESPKLLLIEEPESGIHPRRLHEVMNFIFDLADRKGIQIIITTHNTQVVDEFEDYPESIFIFDKEAGETKVKNLFKDVIKPSDDKSKRADMPKIDYTKTLGEHWIYGFIGGVPL